MASAVLGIVGSVTLGPLGASLGGVIGGIIDNELLFPLLFPDEPVDGPRLDTHEIQSGSEGSPTKFCQGPQCRLAGTLIWLGPNKEVSTTFGAGGKGSSGGGSGGSSAPPQQIIRSYFQSVAIGMCEGLIDSVSKIWVNGDMLYEDDNTPSVGVPTPVTDLSVDTPPSFSPSGLIDHQRINSVSTDLSVFRVGYDVTITGFVDSENNGTFEVLEVGENFIIVDNDGSIEAAGASVTINQTFPQLTPEMATGINILLGHPDEGSQPVDPTIASFEDPAAAGVIPAYLGLAYIVVEDLALTQYGNRIPNFTFEIKADITITAASAIDRIVQRHDLSPSDFDVTKAVDSICGFGPGSPGGEGQEAFANLGGYVISGPQPGTGTLVPIMTGYDVVLRETDGKLVFFSRGCEDEHTIIENDLAAHEFGAEIPDILKINDSHDRVLPSEVDVQYIDPALDLQRGSQRERRQDKDFDNVLKFDIPIVFTADQARAIAQRELYTPWATRQAVELQLPPSYIGIQEGDKLFVPAYGENFTILVSEVDIGDNFLVQIKGVIQTNTTNLYDPASEDPTAGSAPLPYTPPSLLLHMIDVAPFRASDVLTPGVYYATAAFPKTAVWNGAQLLDSRDAGTSFQLRTTIPDEGNIGAATDQLADGVVGVFDNVNTVNIEMLNGALVSVSQLDVLNGQNIALLANEVIGFTTATLEVDGTYTLSGLLRGLRGTDNDTNTHAVTNDRFVVLDATTLKFQALTLADIGADRQYKAVSTGNVIATVPAVLQTIFSRTLQPFAPTNPIAVRDGSDNISLSWTRVSRMPHDLFSASLPPLLEPIEFYEIDFLTSPGLVLLTTRGVGSATETEYLAVDQTADGATPGDPFVARIFQMSTTVGRGKVREILIS